MTRYVSCNLPQEAMLSLSQEVQNGEYGNLDKEPEDLEDNFDEIMLQ